MKRCGWLALACALVIVTGCACATATPTALHRGGLDQRLVTDRCAMTATRVWQIDDPAEQEKCLLGIAFSVENLSEADLVIHRVLEFSASVDDNKAPMGEVGGFPMAELNMTLAPGKRGEGIVVVEATLGWKRMELTYSPLDGGQSLIFDFVAADATAPQSPSPPPLQSPVPDDPNATGNPALLGMGQAGNMSILRVVAEQGRLANEGDVLIFGVVFTVENRTAEEVIIDTRWMLSVFVNGTSVPLVEDFSGYFPEYSPLDGPLGAGQARMGMAAFAYNTVGDSAQLHWIDSLLTEETLDFVVSPMEAQ